MSFYFDILSLLLPENNNRKNTRILFCPSTPDHKHTDIHAPERKTELLMYAAE